MVPCQVTVAAPKPRIVCFTFERSMVAVPPIAGKTASAAAMPQLNFAIRDLPQLLLRIGSEPLAFTAQGNVFIHWLGLRLGMLHLQQVSGCREP